MALLRFLCIVVFLLAFLHACLLVGFIYQVPGGAKVYDMYLEKHARPWLSYPVKVYGYVGLRLWKWGYATDILDSLYRPLLKGKGEGVSAERAFQAISIRFWNRVVMGSLVVFLWLTLFTRRFGRT